VPENVASPAATRVDDSPRVLRQPPGVVHRTAGRRPARAGTRACSILRATSSSLAGGGGGRRFVVPSGLRELVREFRPPHALGQVAGRRPDGHVRRPRVDGIQMLRPQPGSTGLATSNKRLSARR
jgi:hypothetical protein